MNEIFLDTETTGLSFKDGHKIVEIACIETKDLIPTGKVFHKLINPERDVPEEAFKIHGFSKEFLSNKETFDKIADELLIFIKGKKIIIHNASFDLSFLNGELNAIQKKLVDIKYYIYGSNKYLEKNGMPKTVNDLNKHKFISFGKGAPSPVYNPDWALKIGMHDGKKRKSIMKVNSVSGLLYGVESGVGLAALPEYLVSNSSNIIKVLPKVEGPITEAHFVYPQSLKNTARVQAFRNFLFSKIGDWK